MKTEGSRRRKRGSGTNLDAMKRIRKEMPPSTKVIKPKNRPKPVNNWRDWMDEEEDDFDDDEFEGRY